MQDDSLNTNAVSSVNPNVNASAVPDQTFAPENLSQPGTMIADDGLLAKNAEEMLKRVGATDAEESLVDNQTVTYESPRSRRELRLLGRRLSRELVVALLLLLSLLGVGFASLSTFRHDKNGNPGSSVSLSVVVGGISGSDNNPQQQIINNSVLNLNRNTLISDGHSLTATGDVLVQSEVNSANAFKIQNASGNNLLVANTINGTVTIANLHVGGSGIKIGGDIVSNSNAYSLTNKGLSLGGVLVCTSAGCISQDQGSGQNIDTANLAKLANSQTFSGINHFTSGGNIFNGDGSGLFALNASNINSGTLSDGRLSSNVVLKNGNNTLTGSNTFTQQIQASGGVNAASYSVGGTAGTSLTCPVSQLLSQPVIQGGIITSGLCVPGAGASVATLQESYDASVPATVILSSASGPLSLQDGASPLGTNLFQVTDNSGATKYFAVSASGVTMTGNVNTTGVYQVSGVQISSANLSNDANLAKLNANQTFSGNNTFSSASNSFTGSGAGLTSLNASNISSGTLNDGRLSANVALLNGTGPQTFTGNNKFTGTVLNQNASNSTNAFSIQDVAGSSNLFVADTTNSRIGIGKLPTLGALDVNGSIYQNGSQVCDTSGNCAGVAGIGGGGTNGTIALFNGTGTTIGDSLLTQSGSTITDSGNLNLTVGHTFQVNGSQISSADLSNDSNLAKLNGTQTFSGDNTFSSASNSFTGVGSGLTGLNASNISSGTLNDGRLSANVALLNGTGPQAFTGNNKFTGTVLNQNASDSTNTFSIQNAAGSSNLLIADTTNTRIAIGQATANYTLDVAGDINTTGSFRVGGTTGSSLTCSGGNVLQNPVVSGGIITGGSCIANGGGVTNTLASVYAGGSSQTDETLLLDATRNGVLIRDNSTPIGGTLFGVQNSTGSTKFLDVTASGVTVAGDINISGTYQIGGVQISSSALSNDSNLAKLNGTQTFSGDNTFSSASNSFTGNGAGLSSLNASNISSGTLNDGRLSANVALLNGTGPQTFSGDNKFTGTVLSQNTSNSTAAFQVQNSSSSAVLTVDTSNNKVVINNLSFGGTGNTSQTIAKSMVVTAAVNAHDVVIIDTANAGQVTTTSSANSNLVYGLATSTQGAGATQDIVIGGTYQANVDSTTTIAIGDFIATSGTTGKVTTNNNPAAGTILGRALSAVGVAGAGQMVWVQVTPDVGGGSAGTGVTSIGTIDGQSKSADGAVISGTTLYMQTADTGNPGLVSTGTQSFAGAKTFTGAGLFQNGSNSTTAFQIQNSAGTSNLFIADTTNSQIGINKAPTLGALDVNGSIFQSGSQVCDTSGNCVGVGGGAIGGGGTTGTIPIFTGSGYTVGDSLLTQSGSTVTDNGNLNLTSGHTFQVNGSQISSADLSNDSNLAKLNGTGPQVFTGNNEFTGTVLSQNSSNSTAAFSIQDSGATPLFVADTTNQRISIGTGGTPIGQLYVSGSLPAAALSNTSTGVGSAPSDIVIQGNYAFVATPGVIQTKVYDISTPSAPVFVGNTAPSVDNSKVAVQGRYAYVVSPNGSDGYFQIYDITDGNNVVAMGSIDGASALFNTLSDVAVAGNYAYVTDSDLQQLRVINIANPNAPDDLLEHINFSSPPTSVVINGRYAYVTAGQNLYIIQISSKGDLSLLATLPITGGDLTNVSVSNGYAYVTDTGNGGIQILRVADPSTSSLVGFLPTGFMPTDITVQGRYAYVASSGSSDINIIDISDPTSPSLVGSLSTSGTSPSAIAVLGRYAYIVDSGNDTLKSYDLGGAYIQQLQTGGIQSTSVSATQLQVADGATIQGGLQVGGSTELAGDLGVAGAVTISADSVAALTVSNESGVTSLGVDTANNNIYLLDSSRDGNIQIGSSAPDGNVDLLTLDSYNNASDPTGTNGASYYNDALGKFRCYENGAWTDCIGGGLGGSINLQNAYSNSLTGSVPEIKVDSSRGGIDIQDADTTINGSLFTVRASNGAGLGSALLDINSTGQTTFKNSSNSTAAFQIQDSAGTSNLLVADTTNSRIGIGKAPSSGTLDVNGDIYQNGNQVCDTSGNCVGTGGGGSIGGSGTAGTIAVFSGSGFTVGDSLLSQSGSTVTDNGNLNLTTGHTYQINSIQISSADLSNDSNLAKLNGTQTFTGDNTFSSATNSFTGSGAGLTSLNATNISSGTLADGRLSSNVPLKNAANTFTNTNGIQVTNAAAFQVQSASAAETLLTANTTTRTSGVAGNVITIGNATGTDTATTVLVLDSASSAPTTNLGSLSGGLFYNSGNNHINVVENGVVKELCNKTDLGCGSGATTTLAQAYTNGASQTDNTIALDATRNGVLIRDNSTPLGVTLFGVQNSSGATKYLDVTASTVSVNDALTVSGLITSNGGISVASGQNITFAGSTGNFDQSASTTGTFKTGGGAVSLNGDTTIASGKNFTQSGAGTFSTGSGNNTLNGNTSVAAGKNFSFASGAGNFDLSASSGSFQTSTGTNTLNGDTTIAGTKTFTVNGGNTSLGANLDVTSSVAYKHGVDISTNGSLTDFNFGNASLIRLTGSSTQTINSLQSSGGNRDGEMLTIINAGAGNAFIIDEATTGTTASMRIRTGTLSSITLAPEGSISLIYDSQASRWRVIGDVAGGSGSGVSAVGTFTSCTSYANGAQISSGTITFSCADVTNPGLVSTGAQTWAGAKSFNGLITGSAGLTVTGAAVSLNAGSNFAVNIGTGGNNTQVSIGGGSGTFALDTTNIDISNGGAITGATGLTFVSGNFDQSASGGTFKTGTGAVSINGDTTIAAGKSLSFASGAGNFDAHLGTGTFDTTTGTNTLNGNTTVAGTKTFTVNGGNTSLGANLDVTSSVAFKHGTDVSTTPSLNDLNIGNVSLIRLTGTSTQTLTGIANGRDGYVVTIINAGTQSAVIANANGGSTSGNQILTGTAGNIALPVDGSITLVYDSQANKWRVNGSAAGSSGSGVTTVGTFNSCTSYANGAQISSNTITFSCADVSNPGLVSTGAQTWAGAKSFNALITGSAGLTVTGGAIGLTGNASSSLTTTSGDLTLDATSGSTPNILVGTGAQAKVIQIGMSTNNAVTQTINIGNGGTGSTTNVTVGNANGGTTTIQASGGISLANNTTIASGKNFTQSGGGTFSTGSGTNTLNGATTIAGTNTFTVNGGNTTLGANLDVTSSVAFKHGTDVSTTPSLDDLNIGNVSLIRLTGGTAQTLNGIANGRDGYVLTVINAGSATSTIADAAGTSSPANQIRTGTGGPISLAVGSSISLVYDSQSSRWRVVGDVAGGTGTGVTSIGTFTSCTSYANGAQIVSNAITFSCADITNPGMVSTGAQTWAGAKSFNGLITGNAGVTVSGGAVSLTGNATSSLTTSSGDLTLDATSASTPNVNLGTGGQAKTIQIGQTGTAAVTQTIGIGNGGVGSTTNVTVGNVNAGNTTIQGGTGASAIVISTGASAGTAGTITIGNTTGANTQTINLGTNSTASSTTNVNIGSSIAGTTAVTGPTTITNRTSGSTDTFTVSNSSSTGSIAKFLDGGSVNPVFNLADGGAATFRNQTDSTNAFQIQVASGAQLFQVNTTDLAVINNGTSTPGNLLENPGFEIGGGSTGNGWAFGAQMTPTTNSSNAHTGNREVVGTSNSTSFNIFTGKYYFVQPGDQIYMEGWVKTAAGTDGTGGITAEFTDKDKLNATFTNNVPAAASIGTSYTLVSQKLTVPAGNYYLRVGYTVRSGSTTGTWYFDDGFLQKVNHAEPEILQNSVNSTTAFQIQNAGGTSLFTADTTNTKINLGGDLNVGTNYGDRLFSDNFESGGLSLWTGTNSGITVDSSLVHNGAYSAKMTITGTGKSLQTPLSGGATTIDVRAYAYVTSFTTSAAIIGVGTSTAENPGLYLDSTGHLCFWNSHISTGYCSAGTVSTGAWHSVEFKFTQNGASGSAQAYLDGTQVVNQTGISTGTGTYNSLVLGEASSSKTATINVDDVSVDTTATGPAASLNVSDSLHVGGTSTFGNAVMVQSSSDTTAAFQVQHASGSTLFDVDTVNDKVYINSATNPALVLQNNGTDKAYLGLATSTNGYVTGSATNDFVARTQGGAFRVSNDSGATSSFVLASNGSALFQNNTNSSSAFLVQNAAGTGLFNIDDSSTPNLLTNPSIQQAISGNWATKISATVTQDGTQQYIGSKSLKVITAATADDGVKQAITLSNSTQYSLSFFAKLDGASGAFATLAAGYSSTGLTGGDVNCTLNSTTVVTTGWTRYYCTFTTPGSNSGTPYIYIKQTNAFIHTFYIDAVQLQTGSSAGAFQDGQTAINTVIISPTTFKNQSDSDTALQIQNVAGNSLLTVDTLNTKVSVGDTGVASSVQIGNTTGAVAQTINLGTNSTVGSTTNINIGRVANGVIGSSTPTNINIGTTNSTNAPQAISIGGSGGGTTVDIEAGGVGGITVGTGSFASKLVAGSTNTTSTTLIQGGTGGSALQLATGASAGTAGGIIIGNTTGANSQTISIGNNSTGSSTSNVNIGSSVAGTTTITGPTTVTNRTSGSIDTFNVSNSTSTGTIAKFSDNTTAVFTLADGGAATFQNQTNSSSAFQIQTAGGSSLLSADSISSQLNLARSVFSGNVLGSNSAVQTSTSDVSTDVDTTASPDDAGGTNSIAIGADSLPVVAYSQTANSGTNTTLKFLHCGNSACSSGNSAVTVDSATSIKVGNDISVAIGTDGLPIISYYDLTNLDLRVVHCGNILCSTGNVLSNVDSGSVRNSPTSIAIGRDGFAAIAYQISQNNGALAYAKCNNITCSSSTSGTVIDDSSTDDAGQYASLSIAPDGLPTIAYINDTLGSVKVAHCGNTSCSSGNTTNTLDTGTGASKRSYVTQKIGADGLPIVSYHDVDNLDLKVTHCGNTACSSGSFTTSLDTSNSVGQYSTMAIGTDGLPIIAEKYNTGSDLRFVKCANYLCSSSSSARTITTGDNDGYANQIAIGYDGLPIVSTYDSTANGGDLFTYLCSNASCSGAATNTLTGGINIGGSGQGFQNIYAQSIRTTDAVNPFTIATNNVDRVSIDGSGNTTFKNSSSTNAFNVQNAGGLNVLSVDTTLGNTNLGIGSLQLTGVTLATAPTLVGSTTGGTLTASTAYQYLVAAVSTSGEGFDYPTNPTFYFTTNGTSSVALSWTATPGATTYYVYRSTDGITWKVLDVGNVTSYNDTSNAPWTVTGTRHDYSATGNIYLPQGGGIEFNPAASTFIQYAASINALELGNFQAGSGVHVYADNFKFVDSTGFNTNLAITNTGATTFKNRTDSATAFQIQNSGGTPIFTTDTSAGNIQVGSSTTNATANLLVFDSYNNGTDPTGVTGAMYYNTNTGNFRCYTTTWINCAGTGSSPSLQNAYDNSSSPATITTSSSTKDVVIKSGGGFESTGVFQVQNSAGGSLMNVDSLASNITLLGNNSAETSNWNTTTAINGGSNRREFASVYANGYTYVIGGWDNSGAYQSTVYYSKVNADGTLATWGSTTAIPALTRDAKAVYANGYIYVTGGSISGTLTNAVYYGKVNADGTISSWTTSSNPLPVALWKHASVAANGYIYVLGGAISTPADVGTVYYAKLNADGSTSTWTTSANPLGVSRADLTVMYANGYIYAFGGSSSTTSIYASLNPVTGANSSFTTTGFNLSQANKTSGGFVLNGYVYLLGGFRAGATSTLITTAQINSGGSLSTWANSSTTIPFAREQAGVFTANGYVYVIGGYDGTNTISTSYYGSSPRLKVGGSLDLIGLGGENMADSSSSGGSLTAGNGTFTGTLNVQDQASFEGSVSIGQELNVGGSALFKNAANSTIGFQIQDSSAVGILTVDTTNKYVQIGSATGHSSNPVLLVTDSYNNATEPTEIDGAIYYNASSKNFRCGQSGGWVGCIGGLLSSNTGSSSTVSSCTNACSSIGTASIPANYCQPGRVIKTHSQGRYSSTASPTLQFNLYYGTDPTTRTNDTLLHSTTAPTVTGSSNAIWNLEVTIICWSTGSMNISSVLSISGSGTSTLTVYGDVTGTVSVSTGTTKSIYLFPTWSASNALNGVLMDQNVVTGT